MKVQRTTLTGIDDNTNISDLQWLVEQHPLTEFAVLCSPGGVVRPRYPSHRRIMEFLELAGKYTIALHLCGGAVGKAYESDEVVSSYLDLLNETSSRCQLNFTIRSKADFNRHRDGLTVLKSRYPLLRFIVQYNESNHEFVTAVCRDSMLDVLCDGSGGKGMTPKAWPGSVPGARNQGYAGGLGPDNIVEELMQIKNVENAPSEIWIDMESSLRSQSSIGDVFDISKCLCVLDRVSAFNKLA